MLKYCIPSFAASFAHMSTIPYALYSAFAVVTLPISSLAQRKLWSLQNPAQMQFYMFRLKYSNQRDSDSIAHMSMRAIFHIDFHTQSASSGLSRVKSGTSQIQRICSFESSSLVIQVKLSPYPLQVRQQQDERNTAYLLPNTAHISPFAHCQDWTRRNPAWLQFWILMLTYSNEGISACFAETLAIRCALYSTCDAKSAGLCYANSGPCKF